MKMDKRMMGAFVAVLLLSLLVLGSYGQYDEDIQNNNKFRTNEYVDIEKLIFGIGSGPTPYRFEGNRTKPELCNLDIDLIWRAKVGSGIDSTPIIADIANDGKKEIVINTMQHYIEVLDGETGAKAPGWPFAFANSKFQASPLLYDYDNDGTLDIVVSTLNAEIVFLRETGYPFYSRTLIVPPLKIKADWFDGLDSAKLNAVMSLHGQNPEPVDSPTESQPASGGTGRKLFQVDEDDADQGRQGREKGNDADYETDDLPTEDNRQHEKYIENNDPVFGNDAILKGFEGTLPQEGVESLELFLPTDTPSTYVSQMSSDLNPLLSQYKANNRGLWKLKEGESNDENKFLLLDAHILATPVIADLDGDKSDEIIVAVSYYYDYNDYYGDQETFDYDEDVNNNRAKKRTRDFDVDIEKYVAGGIVVWNIASQRIVFNLPLDLTRDDTSYRGHIYVSPTVADIDRDGKLDIVVATGTGIIYVIDHRGSIKSFGANQLEMDAIYAPVLLLDINNDRFLDIIATDINSNIAAFSGKTGEEIWSNRLSGVVNQEITVSDFNRDGELELIMTTDMGHLWSFSAFTGQVTKNFPINLKSAIYAQPLVIQLTRNGVKEKFVVTNTVGGKLIIVSPTYKGGCIDEIDLGESSYSMVLADDLNSNGEVELIVSTREGSVYCFGTDSESPGSSKLNRGTGGGGDSLQGIEIEGAGKGGKRNVGGKTFQIYYKILDDRKEAVKNQTYNIDVYVSGIRQNSVVRKEVGVYEETIACPEWVVPEMSIKLVMSNEYGQRFEDQLTVSCNLNFAKFIKWLLVIPFGVMVLTLLFIRELKGGLPRHI